MLERSANPYDNISNLLTELNKLNFFGSNLKLIIFIAYGTKLDIPKNKYIKTEVRNIADLRDGKVTFILKNNEDIITAKTNNLNFIQADLIMLKKKHIKEIKLNLLEVIRKTLENDFGKDKIFISSNDLMLLKKINGFTENDFKYRINKETNNVYFYILNKELKKVDVNKIIKSINKKYLNKGILLENI